MEKAKALKAKIIKRDGHWVYQVRGHREGRSIGLCLPEDASEFDLDILFTLLLHHIDRAVHPHHEVTVEEARPEGRPN